MPKTQHTCVRSAWMRCCVIERGVWIQSVWCARVCVCVSLSAAFVIQADSSPSVDPFTDNSPFIENNRMIHFSKCWLILPSSSQHPPSSPPPPFLKACRQEREHDVGGVGKGVQCLRVIRNALRANRKQRQRLTNFQSNYLVMNAPVLGGDGDGGGGLLVQPWLTSPDETAFSVA